ncbi:DMT family transporter [Ramlibacter sp. MAHUQ-53]|uniref:DMT family transporter n=1 Tax=unclassified Ramlibacter TaxID=2617605 RepID=UPI00362FD348
MSTRRPPRPVAYACLALSMALVGAYVALSRPLVAAFPVMLLAWLRFGIGALAMWHWVPRPASEPPMTPRTRALVFLESFLGNFLFSVCMLFGVSMTSAVSAGVIMAAIPAVVALLSRVFLGERITRSTAAAIACAAAGIALLALARQPAGSAAAGPQAWLGNLLVFGAVLCEAAYAVIGKSLTGALGPRRITALINLWGLALVTPFGLWQALSFDFARVTPGQWALLVFYGLAASVWTVWLWMTGLRTVPAAKAGVFTVMLPVSAALVGVLALGEPMGAAQLLALAVSLAGVVLATASGRR